jgi:hypothetical protein
MMFTLPILLLLITLSYARHPPPGSDAVLLGDVKALTLHSDRQTTGRRSSPQPQLQCIGGTARHLAQRIRTVQCSNQGHDGSDYQWRCETTADGVKLGRLQVSCEGYRSPDDDYVLIGSCGLEYELELVSPPAQPVPPPQPKKTTTTTTTTTTTAKTTVPPRVVNHNPEYVAQVIIAFAVIVFILGVISLALIIYTRRSVVHDDYTDRPRSKPSHRKTEPPRETPRETARRVVIDPEPRPIQPTAPIIVQQPPTVVVRDSGFTDGFITGSLLSRPTPVYHHVPYYAAQQPTYTESKTTTTVVTEAINDDAGSLWSSWSDSTPSASWGGGGGSESVTTKPTTSVGFGSTKRR